MLTQEQLDSIQKSADYASLKEHPGFKLLIAAAKKILAEPEFEPWNRFAPTVRQACLFENDPRDFLRFERKEMEVLIEMRRFVSEWEYEKLSVRRQLDAQKATESSIKKFLER